MLLGLQLMQFYRQLAQRCKHKMPAKTNLPSGIYLRHGTYWLRWTPVPGGAQVRQSLGKSDLEEAITEAARIRRTDGPLKREKAGECEPEIDRYLAAKKEEGLSNSTLSSRRYVLIDFCTSVEAATPRHIGSAATQRWYDGHRTRSPHTAVAYLRQVRWWIDWLIERGKLTRDPTSAIKIPKLKMQARRRFLMPDEARSLLEACATPNTRWRKKEDLQVKEAAGLHFAVMCGLHAGMRKLEIIEARPDWFDLSAGLIHIQATATFQPKDRDNRTVPMTDDFKGFLSNYGLRTPFMLHPEVAHGKYRYRYDFRKAFDGLTARAGLADVTFHDLRRTFASLLVSKGVSLYKVAKWLGDELDTVQQHYGHLIPQDDEINVIWK